MCNPEDLARQMTPWKSVEETQGIQFEQGIQEVIHSLVFVFIPRMRELLLCKAQPFIFPL